MMWVSTVIVQSLLTLTLYLEKEPLQKLTNPVFLQWFFSCLNRFKSNARKTGRDSGQRKLTCPSQNHCTFSDVISVGDCTPTEKDLLLLSLTEVGVFSTEIKQFYVLIPASLFVSF